MKLRCSGVENGDAAERNLVVQRQDLLKLLVAQTIRREPAIDAGIHHARQILAGDGRPAQRLVDGFPVRRDGKPGIVEIEKRFVQRSIGNALEDAVFALAPIENIDDLAKLARADPGACPSELLQRPGFFR